MGDLTEKALNNEETTLDDAAKECMKGAIGGVGLGGFANYKWGHLFTP